MSYYTQCNDPSKPIFLLYYGFIRIRWKIKSTRERYSKARIRRKKNLAIIDFHAYFLKVFDKHVRLLSRRRTGVKMSSHF